MYQYLDLSPVLDYIAYLDDTEECLVLCGGRRVAYPESHHLSAGLASHPPLLVGRACGPGWIDTSSEDTFHN